MQFLNEELAFLMMKKKTKSLVKEENSCGIFQDYGTQENKTDKESS